MFYFLIPIFVLLGLLAALTYKTSDMAKLSKYERSIIFLLMFYICAIGEYLRFENRVADWASFLKFALSFCVFKFLAFDYIKYRKDKNNLKLAQKTLESCLVHFCAFVVFIYIVIYSRDVYIIYRKPSID